MMSMENAGENLAKIYNELYDLRRDFRNANLLDKIVSLVRGDKILEIGCGNGILLQKLKNNGKNVLGVEPNEDLIKIAKKINPYLNVIHGTAENLDGLVSEKFDAIIMTDVLEHIENDGLLLENFHKYLNRAGQLIIVVPAYQALYGIRDKNIGHYRRYSRKTLSVLLENKKYKVKRIFYWNMLGVIPYFLSEKIWHKPLHTDLRSGGELSVFKKLISKALFVWFKYVENKINLGFGLSVICVASKKESNTKFYETRRA